MDGNRLDFWGNHLEGYDRTDQGYLLANSRIIEQWWSVGAVWVAVMVDATAKASETSPPGSMRVPESRPELLAPVKMHMKEISISAALFLLRDASTSPPQARLCRPPTSRDFVAAKACMK